MEEQRGLILKRLLSSEAKERCKAARESALVNMISLVKPEKGHQLEGMLI